MIDKIKANVPNTITCFNLLCGCLAVISAFNANVFGGNLTSHEWTSIFIAAAAVFDFCDGAVARMMHAYSDIGKELDSLSDLISFGVAPAMLMFCVMAGMPETEAWMPYTALLIAICGGIRLARFNVDTRQSHSFIGLPIPANAIFWIGASAWLMSGLASSIPAWSLIIAIVLISLSMLLPIPLFSLKFKNFTFSENWPRFLIIAATAGLLIAFGLPGLSLSILLYILMGLLLGTERH